jgi:hypothetical protein
VTARLTPEGQAALDDAALELAKKMSPSSGVSVTTRPAAPVEGYDVYLNGELLFYAEKYVVYAGRESSSGSSYGGTD